MCEAGYNADMAYPLALLERYILLTLTYSHIFSQPLTTEEVARRLIYSDEMKNDDAAKHIETALFNISAKKIIKKNSHYWQLTSTSEDLSEIRKRRERMSRLKIKELQPFINVAKNLRWITGVALTGSVSVNNAEAKDDVDLMIIVQPQRLWLVRPLLVLFSFSHGKRRSWNHEEFNSWCLNLWLEEDVLSLPRQSRTLYTAYEVCQAEWLVSKNDIANRFLESNTWVGKYLPEYFLWKLTIAGLSAKHPTQPNRLVAGFFDLLNEYSYMIQLWYMKRHMTREKVTRSMAFFHPRDTKKNIMQSWKEIVLSIN